MIVTRSWLQDYIDLSDISNKVLFKRLNEIGLEVDSIKEYKIPEKVVVGEVIECKKHENSDHLNICKVNIGKEIVQIVCGAANVVDAKYVAVATVGANLGDGFVIKEAKLRGEESFGMICSSSELGLPAFGDGIMILDNSIGELIVGKELNEYEKVADTVIEIELTANRGDCLSIYGVARDLAAAFKKDLKIEHFEVNRRSVIGVAKELSITSNNIPAHLSYSICEIEELKSSFLHNLRLAFVNIETNDTIDTLVRYAMHTTGVILRAYDFEKLSSNGKVKLTIEKTKKSIVEVKCNESVVSIVGANQNSKFKATKESNKVLIEASYIEPDCLIEGVSSNKLETDELYYNSSRGSEPNIEFGLNRLQKKICSYSKVIFSSGEVKIGEKLEPKKIALNIDELNAIIGNNIARSEIVNILQSLGFKLNKVDESSYATTIPLHFHDIKNLQDLAEEVLRIYGIDNIESVHSTIVEKNRITSTYKIYKALRDIRENAVGAGYFEALTYVFTNKELLQKYNFDVIKENKEILNPIVKELNTLRTTILVNLLEAASKNVKYGKKSIALFEIGTVFNSNREESQKAAFIFSGEEQRASIVNSAKAKPITIESFVKSIGSIIGEFELVECKVKNALMHPYISGEIVKDSKSIGYLAKLHPSVAKDFDLKDTFIAEIELESILPKHITAKDLSNFQAVNKDLSIVINKDLTFYNIAKALQEFKESEALLKEFYPLDIYSDDSLGDKKSLTIRFTLQSNEKTLIDSDIEAVINKILDTLKTKFNAELR